MPWYVWLLIAWTWWTFVSGLARLIASGSTAPPPVRTVKAQKSVAFWVGVVGLACALAIGETWVLVHLAVRR